MPLQRRPHFRLVWTTMVLVAASLLGTARAGAADDSLQREQTQVTDHEPVVARPAAYLCRGMGVLAWPILMPLAAGHYDSAAWSRDPGQCYGLLAESVMGAAAVGISFAEPRSSPVFGAGSFDRFFRDAFRNKSKTDDFFDSGLGTYWSPFFLSAAALLTSATVAGSDAYRDTATRALPLLWIAVAGNSLPTQVFKKSFGRERPYLKFDNQKALDEFGDDDDAHESFYSGHASTAFLSASFIDRVVADAVRLHTPDYSLFEGSTWQPRLLRLGQAVVFYGFAAAVAYSRIAVDQHYMTDVLTGALVGTTHGQVLYHWSYRREGSGAVPTVSALHGAYGLMVSWRF